MTPVKHTSVEEYIHSFPEEVMEKMQQLRKLILSSAKNIEEKISWNMPGYKYEGKPLAYFAAHKLHIGFYPTASPIKRFEKELKNFKTSKGAIQFLLSKPLPVVLIKSILKFRIQQIKLTMND